MYNVGTLARLKGVTMGILLRGALMIFMPLTSLGQGSAVVAWNASTNTGVAGYNVYYGNASRSYSNVVNAGANLSAALTNLTAGKTYFIAVTAFDGLGNESDYSTEVSYTVPGFSDQPPTIGAIASESVLPGQSTGALPFTIGDPDTAVTSLTLSALSTNTTLVPNANIVFGGSGSNRTVTVTPAAGKTGSAQITVTVSDGTLTAQSSFMVTVQAPQDHAPTITAITNQNILEGHNTGAVPFTIGDPDTGPTGLTLSVASANTTLVPNANIVFGGSGSNRTVTVTPAASQTGSAQITVTVSDGTLTAQSSFMVTVQAPQDHAPTITAITNQNILEGHNTGALPFTIGDQDTGTTGLSLTAASSNPTLVPNGNIGFGGSAGKRTVTVTPAAGQTGSAQITITVSDGTLSSQSSFAVTVQAVQPHAPTITAIPAQSIYSGESTPGIPFTINDVDTGPASLTLSAVSSNPTLVPNGNIVFAGSGGNRTVTVTSVSGQTGTAQITITVSDGSLTAQSSFTVTVQVATAMVKSTLPKSTTYNGLFYESSTVRLQSAGSVKITVTSAGKYTGSLQMAGGKYSFSGAFGTFCVGTNVIARKNGTPLYIGFSLQPGAKAGQLQGTLSDGTWAALINGGQAVFNTRTNPAPFLGSYTLMVPGTNASAFSLGNGFGSLTVDGNGNVKFSGSLADGTKVTQSSGLMVDGTWPLFIPLYAGQGMVIGWVSFTNRVDDDLNGPVNWIKTANPLSKYYPEGLTIQSSAMGSKFVSAAPNPIVFGQAKLQLGNVGNGLVMSLKLAKTGTFTGQMFNPATGKPMPFQGALLQKVSTGYGFLLGTNQSSASIVLTH